MKTTRSDSPRLIPITGLRHLYRHLRGLPKKQYQLHLATEFVRKPTYLQKLVRTSFNHFAYYDNPDEGFRRNPGKVTPRREKSPHLSNKMVSVFSGGKLMLFGGQPVPLSFVDYDISPFRTTDSAVFEDGTSGSAAGGIDLLLESSASALPVIGEVKAPSDTSLFMAYIQALTYAVEMATPAQRTRLERFYPGRFQWPADGPWVDICLLSIHTKQDSWNEQFMNLTRNLAKATVVPDTAIGKNVRSVTCYEVTFVASDEAVLTSRFQSPCAA